MSWLKKKNTNLGLLWKLYQLNRFKMRIIVYNFTLNGSEKVYKLAMILNIEKHMVLHYTRATECRNSCI